MTTNRKQSRQFFGERVQLWKKLYPGWPIYIVGKYSGRVMYTLDQPTSTAVWVRGPIADGEKFYNELLLDGIEIHYKRILTAEWEDAGVLLEWRYLTVEERIELSL